MSRNTDLQKVLFPVELHPIGYSDSESQPEQGDTVKPIKRYKAVVRTDNGEVFSVVSERYELLHNKRALEHGRKAFKLLFPETEPEEFIVFDIKQTKTGSACHIDLIHPSYNVNVWEQETWLPFLRVSNSYNRSRALTFDFGFVRKLCSNGLIFQKQSIKAKFYHTKGELSIDFSTDERFKTLKVLEEEFASHMEKLRAAELEEELLAALSLHFLGLKFNLNQKNQKQRGREEERKDLVIVAIRKLINKYKPELGVNAYTALNVATDLATHSEELAGPFVNSATMQITIGERSQEIAQNTLHNWNETLKEEIALVS